MSAVPEEPTDVADPALDTPPPGELDAWIAMLRQAAAAGATLSSLAGLELRLALADGGRLLVLGMLILPLAVILACRRYAASLSLPATRRHLQALMEGARDAAKPVDR